MRVGVSFWGGGGGRRGRPPATPMASLIALRKWIWLDEFGLVKHLCLAIRLPLADAQFAPQMVVALMHPHIPFRGAGELDAGRRGRHLVNVEAAAFFHRKLP